MIYIKDMDMPVDCLGCRISCKHESYRVPGRPEDCPLEEAKDGDLISRADAIEAVRKELVCDGRHETHDKTCRFIADVLLSALPSAELVLQTPQTYGKSINPSNAKVVGVDYSPYRIQTTAPSAEAVQGEWIDIDNYYRMATCSHCRKVTMFEKWGECTKPYNFCPNCGAKMKGGDSE